jgi:hypothetical protein
VVNEQSKIPKKIYCLSVKVSDKIWNIRLNES